jgi:hypothetical protein
VLSKKTLLIRLSVSIYLLATLSACSGNSTTQGWFAPDPKLKQNSQASNSTPTPVTTPTPTPTPTSTSPLEKIPSEIPRYGEAQLLEISPDSTTDKGSTRWTSSTPSNLIEAFYQEQFQSNKWEIIAPFSPNETNNTLVARRDGLEVRVAIAPNTTSSSTEFTIEYQRENQQVQPSPQVSPQGQVASDTPLNFTDLEQTPQALRPYVEDLARLGILTSKPGTPPGNLFKPNGIITRRDYARWLVSANNKLFANSPGKQIRLAVNTSQAVFSDVPQTDPDFTVIQGLAEAGLIPSSLKGDSNALLFRPEAPLTRENLILWKVPLDNRQALPSTSVEGIKQTWGFQDAAKTDPIALRALAADFQNGEQANLRRVFGFTTLFQPKKTVTRAEAAGALWYFGFQGDGISGKDALNQ